MIVSFTHDCGCVFSRTPPEVIFTQSHSCVKHAVKESSRAVVEPYTDHIVTPTPAEIQELHRAAETALRQTPFGELLVADQFD